MTLREMIAAHPDKFYPQTWYEGEAFMDVEARDIGWPHRVVQGNPKRRGEYTAADLAHLWVTGSRTHPLWDSYLWTSDTDSQGQRVYVGQNGKGLEIHRHLHLTDRWGVPV